MAAWQALDRRAAPSPDGRRMLRVGADGVATPSGTGTGEVLARWQHDRRPSAVALYPLGRCALVALDSFVLLVNTGTLEVLHTWRHRAPVIALALSPDGRRVLMGLAGGEGVLGDAETGAVLRTWEHPGSGGDGLMAAAFSPDGRRRLAGGANRTAVLRSVRTGEILHSWEIGYRVKTIGTLVHIDFPEAARDEAVTALRADIGPAQLEAPAPRGGAATDVNVLAQPQ